MADLDSLLNEEESEPTPVVQEVAPEPAPVSEAPAVVRDEHGRFAPKGVDDGAPPAPTDQLPQEEYKALKAEREKRQSIEGQLAAMQQELAALKNPPAPPPPPVSVFEDEQGWQQQFGSQVVTQAVNQASLNARLDMSEMMVRQANPDFEDVKAEFLRLAEVNPTLREQALADPHPWNKAYQIAKNHKTMTELGATDIETLKARLREEILAESAEQQPAARPGLPPSLSQERNVGSRSGPAWTGPTALSDLLS